MLHHHLPLSPVPRTVVGTLWAVFATAAAVMLWRHQDPRAALSYSLGVLGKAQLSDLVARQLTLASDRNCPRDTSGSRTKGPELLTPRESTYLAEAAGVKSTGKGSISGRKSTYPIPLALTLKNVHARLVASFKEKSIRQ